MARAAISIPAAQNMRGRLFANMEQRSAFSWGLTDCCVKITKNGSTNESASKAVLSSSTILYLNLSEVFVFLLFPDLAST